MVLQVAEVLAAAKRHVERTHRGLEKDFMRHQVNGKFILNWVKRSGERVFVAAIIFLNLGKKSRFSFCVCSFAFAREMGGIYNRNPKIIHLNSDLCFFYANSN